VRRRLLVTGLIACALVFLTLLVLPEKDSRLPKPGADHSFAVESTESPSALEKEEMQMEDPSNGYGPGGSITSGHLQIVGNEPRRYELFRAGLSQEIDWKKNTPAAHRACSVFPDVALLTPTSALKVGDQLELRLFEDVVLEAQIANVTTYSSGTVGMTAQMEGEFAGVLYLTYSGNELRISADVLGGNDYYVRFDPSTKQHIALEVDRAASDYLECKDCAELKNRVETAPASTPVVNDGPEQMANDSSDVVVDVMVVYTPAAKAYEGSVSGIYNNIAMAMQKANTVHGNSDTQVILNLVHVAETAYVESGSGNTDLRRLTYTGGVYSDMDEVHDLRDEYGADMVCLFADVDYTGGIAWLLDSSSGEPDLAFSMARIQQSDWSYTVVHEWGHNMGCGHSKTQTTQNGPGIYSYSAGWQWSDSASSATIGFCSVMTYENFDSSGSNEYVRVAHFSNPDIDFSGNSTNSTGNASDGDSARTIRELSNVFSAYRASVDPVDTDSDGMPDLWEMQYFGNSTNAVASLDSDGDRTDNLTEYIAGTNPTNAASFFSIINFTVTATTDPSFIVSWEPVYGRIYGVAWSDQLNHTFTNISGDLPYPTGSYTDTVERAGPQHFYRIGVRMEQ
jgi:hypothetical protein